MHMREFGDYVSVYDRNGRFDCRGKITGRYRSNPMMYDVLTDGGDSLRAIPDARLRIYIPVKDEEPKHIRDEV